MSAVFPNDPDDRWRSYTAAAAQTDFSIPFPFQDDDDITILKVALDGTVTTLARPADYTMTGAENPAGGSFFLAVPAAAGEKFLPIGNAVLERVLSIVRGGRYNSAATDEDLDRLMIIAQEHDRDIGRSWKAAYGIAGGQITAGADGELAKFEDGNVVGSGENADTIEGSTAAAVAAAAAAAVSQANAAASAAAAAASAEEIALGLNAKPFVILTSGQSNMANRLALVWAPSPNAKIWDFWAQTDLATRVGTGFLAIPNNLVCVGMSLADRIAREQPLRKVYLIDVAAGGKAIADWGPAPPTYNFRQAIGGNVPAALAAIGATTIDMFVWWQGESDASNASTTYPADFETLMTWLKGHTWFKNETPVMMFGLPPYAESVPGDKYYLKYAGMIKACVANEPGTRRFISTEGFPITLWDPAMPLPYIHMTATGYKAAGEKAALAAIYGMFEPVLPGVVYNPGNFTMSFGASGGFSPTGIGNVTDYQFTKTVAAGTLRMGLTNTASTGAAVHSVTGGAGAWSLIANDLATNFGSLFWGGANGALIAATNAAGILDLAAGGFTTRLSIRSDGLFWSPGAAAPASLPNGGLAPVFVDAETAQLVGRSGGVNRTKTIRLKPSSGSYNPTFSSLSNLDSASGFNWRWTRTDDIVTVVGQVTQDATAAGAYSYEVTLPVNAAAFPTFVAGVDCGVGQGENGIALAVAGANRVKIQGQAVLTTATTHAVMFSYTVAQSDG
ncbi:MAG: hypothetical protein HOQ20_10765 [Bradyrhizobium sp.]|nr:hypothetical protein [Bradyrhizobium sp.]